MINICIEVINQRGQLIDELCVGIRRHISVNKYKINDYKSEENRVFNFEIEAVLSNKYILIIELLEEGKIYLKSEFDILLSTDRAIYDYNIKLKNDVCVLSCVGFESIDSGYS